MDSDFNNDDVLDLVIGNHNSTMITVILSTRPRKYLMPVNYYCGSLAAQNLAVGDFNKDSNMDLAIATTIAENIKIYSGDGEGDLYLTQELTTGGMPTGILVDDLNMDDHLDIATINFGGDNISIFIGDDSANFNLPPAVNLGASPVFCQGDFNEDGLPDLAVTVDRLPDKNMAEAALLILTGNGSGRFAISQNYYLDNYPASIHAGDLNHDRHDDLVVVIDHYNLDSDLPKNDNISIFIWKDISYFQNAEQYPVGFDHSYNSRNSTIIDLDNDGNLDIVTTSLSSVSICVSFGDGFGGVHSTLHYSLGSVFLAVTQGDFDGDKVIDLALFMNNGSISVLLSKGTRKFISPVISSVSGKYHTIKGIDTGDMNNDGKMDIVATDSRDSLNIYLGEGTGKFSQPKVIKSIGGPRSIVIDDFNNDNVNDIVCLSDKSNHITILLGEGGTEYSLANNNYYIARLSKNIISGDFNMDGNRDLATSSSGKLLVLLGNGEGQFYPPPFW